MVEKSDFLPTPPIDLVPPRASHRRPPPDCPRDMTAAPTPRARQINARPPEVLYPEIGHQVPCPRDPAHPAAPTHRLGRRPQRLRHPLDEGGKLNPATPGYTPPSLSASNTPRTRNFTCSSVTEKKSNASNKGRVIRWTSRISVLLIDHVSVRCNVDSAEGCRHICACNRGAIALGLPSRRFSRPVQRIRRLAPTGPVLRFLEKLSR